MGRHREAVEAFLERAEGDEVTVSTLRGLADRFDQIEMSGGEGAGQIPQLAAVLLDTAGKLRIPVEDALDALEAELRAL